MNEPNRSLLKILPGPKETRSLNTSELRENFLLQNLFTPGQLTLVVTDLDRAVLGGACPSPGETLHLESPSAMASDYFCERRELGVMNLGEPGMVTVDGTEFSLNSRETLYISRGSREILFTSANASSPVFYLVSYPAHTQHPTQKASASTTAVVQLGSKEEANERTLRKCIYPGGIESCQLVMGFTEMAAGSVWNTMPSHTHLRRSEVYCYFDVPDSHAILHVMGEPAETRHLWVGDREVVLSPAWSVHSGAGTKNYSFVWAMGGENQRFDDMDRVEISELR